MMRVLADASSLIALAQCGELDVLRALVADIHVTSLVFAEAAHPSFPEHEALLAARDAGWLKLIPHQGKPEKLGRYGVDIGEASLMLAADPNDPLILDDRNARRLAEARGLQRIGLLGLLVAGAEEGIIPPERAEEVIRKLAGGSFRMSVDLYQWAMRRIHDAKNLEKA
ncbi:MAG TPA: hypothetical protein VM370_09025 [Candidatus Thermoplasmatota archaeon]|nr:hypothetical protein [Candidatus Thermoplasmatota archaeon]